ncbi:MAG: hypothetical protein A2Z20_09550 [Bdellovibrionales bacterium RBG_16_40_8]|nr:MAG: hypothetical protein A2Z20_09550 [Bdellovibrionales bacterium RBG_16_40_8]
MAPHSGIKLDFGATPVWPKVLPALIWKGVQLTDFFTENKTEMIEVEEGASVEELLAEIYPKLKLVELSNLYKKTKEISLNLNWEFFCVKYGLRFSDNFLPTLELVANLPDEVKKWCINKDVSERDFAPLMALPVMQKGYKYLVGVVGFNPSRNDGVRLFELIADLVLSDADLHSLFAEAKNLNELSRSLWSVRFPLAAEQSQKLTELVKTLPWPLKTQARAVRVGDQSGVEVKMFIHSREDIRKYLDGLAAVDNVLASQNIQRL